MLDLTGIETREIVNLSWAIWSWLFVLFIGWRLLDEMRISGWYNDLGNRLSLSFLVYFIGSGINRLWNAAFLFGWTDQNATYYWSGIGALIALLGTLCGLRILSKNQVGHWGWMITLFSTVIVALWVWARQ